MVEKLRSGNHVPIGSSVGRAALALVLVFTLLSLVVAKADQAYAATMNEGNPYENGDLVWDQNKHAYRLAGVTLRVGGIQELGWYAPPFAYPSFLMEANAAGDGNYPGWGLSRFSYSSTWVVKNTRDLSWNGDLPTTGHCCQSHNETTYDLPRNASLFVLPEESYWSPDGSVYHATLVMLVENAHEYGLWDQGTMGATKLSIEWQVSGWIDLQKESADTSITDGNSCYSLQNAEYGIYRDAQATVEVASITTNAAGYAKSGKLAPGSYVVKEKTPPQGYMLDSTIYSVTVTAGKTARVNGTTVKDRPGSNTAGLLVGKKDAETGKFSAQGAATLAGAEFTLEYYDGYYANAAAARASGAAKRTWVYASDGEGVVSFRRQPVGGDPVYTAPGTGLPVLPYGTYLYYETKAPAGYLLPTGNELGVYVTRIIYDAGMPKGEAPDWSPYTRISGDVFPAAGNMAASSTVQQERVVRGGVGIGKYDRELSAEDNRTPLGSATLEGAEFQITSENPQPVIVDGVGYGKGQVVKTIATDATGYAATASDALPYGTYSMRETAAPTGYLGSSAAIRFTIREQGVVVDLSRRADSFANQVKRGDFEGVKVEESTLERMAGIPFAVVSNTTGETHIIVTDANGMFSTGNDWNEHSHKTNANDNAVIWKADGSYAVDETKLDSEAGIWFGEAQDHSETAPVDNQLGALPYDTYTVTELACKANDGHRMLEFEITIQRNKATVNLGTLTNDFTNQIDLVKIDASTGEPLPGVGLKLVRLQDNVVVWEGASTEEGIVVRDVIPGYYELVETKVIDGYAMPAETVQFYVSATSPVTAVSMENDYTKATVIKRDAATGDALEGAHMQIRDAQDEVVYEFISGPEAYEIVGIRQGTYTLYETEAPATHKTPHFEPYTFVVDEQGLIDGLPTHEIVVDNERIEIGTQAWDKDSGTQHVVAGETAAIVDTVSFKGLRIGGEYTLSGTLIDKATGEPLLVDEKPVTASKTFVPETEDGVVEIEFTFDASALAGSTIVVFESLVYDGIEVAAHADIEDKGQTVTVIDLGTTALALDTGTHETQVKENITIVDAVAYRGLTVGQEYTVRGILMDKATNKPFLVHDAEVVAETTFTAEEQDGTAYVGFTFDGTGFAGTSVVVFETLYLGDATVATHADMNNEGQTVSFVDVPEESQPAPPVEKGSGHDKTGNELLKYVPIALSVLGIAIVAVGAYGVRKHAQARRMQRLRKYRYL